MKINRWQIGRRAITCPLATLITSQNRDILRFPTAINHLNMPLKLFSRFSWGDLCERTNWKNRGKTVRYTSWFDAGRRWSLNGERRQRAIHFETPAIPENETFRRNRSMLMAEQWPQKQLDNSTAGAGTFVARTWLFVGSPPQNRPKPVLVIRRNSTIPWEKTKIKLPRRENLSKPSTPHMRYFCSFIAFVIVVFYIQFQECNQLL